MAMDSENDGEECPVDIWNEDDKTQDATQALSSESNKGIFFVEV